MFNSVKIDCGLKHNDLSTTMDNLQCHDAYNVPGAKVDVEGRLCAVGTVKVR